MIEESYNIEHSLSTQSSQKQCRKGKGQLPI